MVYFDECDNNTLTLNNYQEKAMSTCMKTSDNFSYMFLNLVGELGEFASKVAKGIRKDKICIGCSSFDEPENELYIDDYPADAMYGDTISLELKKEAGDILWQLAGLCYEMGWPLEEVAQMNLDKLQARKQNGTIDGNGDGVTKEERA